jgi:radical SAM protein with 4Fe4S-binding SPASM domain
MSDIKFKKIYIEISNICNLDCPFCLKTNRKKKMININEFKHILDEIKPYTDYLYFHVLGEPLLHPLINDFLDEAVKRGFKVNITTNGYLINNLKSINVRQLNISLHSYNEIYNKDLYEYLNDLYNYAIINSNRTYINFRLWVKSNYYDKIIKFFEEKFNKKIDSSLDNIKLDNNIFLNFDNEFEWPNLESKSKESFEGFCHALTDHIAILSDGTVTACCLDGTGRINFGNIFESSIDDIINSKLFIDMKANFQNGKRIHPLCKKCNFISIKQKNN